VDVTLSKIASYCLKQYNISLTFTQIYKHVDTKPTLQSGYHLSKCVTELFQENLQYLKAYVATVMHNLTTTVSFHILSSSLLTDYLTT